MVWVSLARNSPKTHVTRCHAMTWWLVFCLCIFLLYVSLLKYCSHFFALTDLCYMAWFPTLWTAVMESGRCSCEVPLCQGAPSGTTKHLHLILNDYILLLLEQGGLKRLFYWILLYFIDTMFWFLLHESSIPDIDFVVLIVTHFFVNDYLNTFLCLLASLNVWLFFLSLCPFIPYFFLF